MDQQNSSLQRAIAQFEAHIRELQQQQLQPQAEQLEEVPRRPPPPLIRRDLLQRGFPASIDIDKPFSHSVLSALADGQPTHIFVAGPPRSGRSSILARIAQAAHSGGLGWAYISTGTELALLMRRNMRAVESGSEAYLSPPHSDKLLLIVDDVDYYSPREYKYYAHADFGLFRLFPSHITGAEIEGMVYGTASGRLLWWLPEPNSHYCNNTYFQWVLSSYPPARVLRSNAPGVEWTFNLCSMRAGVGYFVADIGRESIIFREELIDKLLTLGVQNVIEADSPLGDRLWWAYQRDIDWVEREFEPLPEDDD